jgi:hypothetical protein
MGVFDIFTGKPGKEAAAANQGRLEQLKTEGMGYLTAGTDKAIGALDTAGNYYDPLATKYGAGTNLYLDSLGVNGPEGNTRATDAYHTAPGYDFKVNQSLDALDRRAASRGLLASGNNTLDTLSTVHGIADQDYSGWQDRLAGLINPEQTAVAGQAGMEAAKAPVYTNDAAQRVALDTGVTNGINNQVTQGANATMAGSGNLWNFGLNAAKLFAGLPGGTSNLGVPATTNAGYALPGQSAASVKF